MWRRIDCSAQRWMQRYPETLSGVTIGSLHPGDSARKDRRIGQRGGDRREPRMGTKLRRCPDRHGSEGQHGRPRDSARGDQASREGAAPLRGTRITYQVALDEGWASRRVWSVQWTSTPAAAILAITARCSPRTEPSKRDDADGRRRDGRDEDGIHWMSVRAASCSNALAGLQSGRSNVQPVQPAAAAFRLNHTSSTQTMMTSAWRR
jgi:hypothetical protein